MCNPNARVPLLSGHAPNMHPNPQARSALPPMPSVATNLPSTPWHCPRTSHAPPTHLSYTRPMHLSRTSHAPPTHLPRTSHTLAPCTSHAPPMHRPCTSNALAMHTPCASRAYPMHPPRTCDARRRTPPLDSMRLRCALVPASPPPLLAAWATPCTSPLHTQRILKLQAKEHSSPFRALVLIGVAAAFCAAFIPNTTKPCVASKLAEADHAVVSPPQWLPVLLASSSDDRRLSTVAACVPHWVSGEVNSFSATASMVPAIVTLDGVQIGHPVETGPSGTTSCDEIASLGVDDGIVRGVSVRINQGFSVPIIGNGGELIEFRQATLLCHVCILSSGHEKYSLPSIQVLER